MFTISNLELKKFNYKIQNYFINANCDYVDIKNEYIFLFEGYLYPDIKYKEKDLINYFLRSLEKFNDFKKFKGKYSGVFIDLIDNKVLFFNDQLGLKDIFYYHVKKNFIISTTFSEICNQEYFTTDDIDIDSINEFLVFEYPLLDNTFIKDLKILPLSSIYKLEDTNITKFNYWKYEFKEDKNFDENESIEKLDELFNNSMKRIKALNGDKIYGVGLSGGLDSRLVAHYALKNNMNINSFIFGESNSDAFLIAKKIAKKLNISLKTLEIEEDFIKYAKRSAKFNPMMSILYTWYYSVFDRLPKFDILLTGFNGDNQFGSHYNQFKLNFPFDNNISDGELSNKILTNYNESNIKLDIKIKNENIQKFLDKINNSPLNKIENFNYQCRQLKFIKNNPSFNFFGTFVGISIFEDIDLVEYLLTLPYEWKYDLKLYRLFHKKKIADLKNIRTERSFFFDNKILMTIERIIKILDVKIFKTRIFYKQSHKEVQNWLKSNDFFYDYCKKILNVENHFFYENFNHLDLDIELDLIYEGNSKGNNYQLFFRILTIKLWLDYLDFK